MSSGSRGTPVRRRRSHHRGPAGRRCGAVDRTTARDRRSGRRHERSTARDRRSTAVVRRHHAGHRPRVRHEEPVRGRARRSRDVSRLGARAHPACRREGRDLPQTIDGSERRVRPSGATRPTRGASTTCTGTSTSGSATGITSTIPPASIRICTTRKTRRRRARTATFPARAAADAGRTTDGPCALRFASGSSRSYDHIGLRVVAVRR